MTPHPSSSGQIPRDGITLPPLPDKAMARSGSVARAAIQSSCALPPMLQVSTHCAAANTPHSESPSCCDAPRMSRPRQVSHLPHQSSRQRPACIQTSTAERTAAWSSISRRPSSLMPCSHWSHRSEYTWRNPVRVASPHRINLEEPISSGYPAHLGLYRSSVSESVRAKRVE